MFGQRKLCRYLWSVLSRNIPSQEKEQVDVGDCFFELRLNLVRSLYGGCVLCVCHHRSRKED